MANLSGQTINTTYPGLLNLQTATTGITPTLQSITDGYGNDTGLRIGTNQFTAPNVFGSITMNPNSYAADYYGVPSAGTVYNPGAGSQNRCLYTYFYDSGNYAYSAFTINLDISTSTSDVVNGYFYTLQFVKDHGAVPKDLIMSGLTIPSTGSTGFRTVTLPSTLSFSGTGGGYYCFLFVIANSGVTPTVRYRQGVVLQEGAPALHSLGMVRSTITGQFNIANRAASFAGTQTYILNMLPVASFSTSDITTNFNNTVIGARLGFGLDTVK